MCMCPILKNQDMVISIFILYTQNHTLKVTHFGRLFTDFGPVQVAVLRFVDHMTAAVEAQDVIPHAARSAGLHLVFVTEKFLSSLPSAIVQTSVG